MPGRLEFEHEVENEAEIPVKDMESGLVYKYGGDEQPEAAVVELKPTEEEEGEGEEAGDGEADEVVKKEEVEDEEEEEEEEKPLAKANGSKKKGKEKEKKKDKDKGKAKEEEEEEEVPPPTIEFEDERELEVKLALLDIYFSKLDKREEAKDLIFDRCLTEYKKVRKMRRWCRVALLTLADTSSGEEATKR